MAKTKTKKRKCGKCGGRGHYRTTCKKKAKKKTGVKRKKKVTKKKKKVVRKKKATKKKKTTRKKTRLSTTRSTGKRHLIGSGKGWKLFHYAGVTKKGNLSNTSVMDQNREL